MNQQDILNAATSITDKLRAESANIEIARQIPENVNQMLAKQRLYQLLTPNALGGLEVSPVTFSAILQQLALGDASGAWCSMIANTSALIGAFLAEDIAHEVFAKPDVLLAGVFAPRGKAVDCGDHYQVSGQWQWGSGSPNADWIAGGCLILKDGEPIQSPSGMPANRMILFERSQVELIDTWHVSGLKGTGSGDFRVTNLNVDKSYSVSLVDDPPTDPGDLYKFPVFGLLAAGIASVAIGNARASLDALATTAPSSPSALFRAEFARSEAILRSASAFLDCAIKEVWQVIISGEALNVQPRSNLRLACTYATRTAADVTRTAYELGGGAAVFQSSELQRRFRDGAVMTQHIMVAPHMYDMTGKVLLGNTEAHPLL